MFGRRVLYFCYVNPKKKLSITRLRQTIATKVEEINANNLTMLLYN